MKDLVKIVSKQYPDVTLKVIPGHFVTPNSHINYYLDMSTLKTRQNEAAAVARAISDTFSATTVVDTILCIEGCEVIGAYLANNLTEAGVLSMNAHKTIYITSPEYNNAGQIILRDNLISMIKGKNVLLLLASATTGLTIGKATSAIQYYGGTISGIAAIFSAATSIHGIPIHSLFSTADIPDYRAYNPEECAMCREKTPVDGFANGFGYTKV